MEKFEIIFKSSVRKDFRKISNHILSQILKKIAHLEIQPFPHGCKKLVESESLYRIRTGDYRIIYEVNKSLNQIIIHYVRHRKDVYRAL